MSSRLQIPLRSGMVGMLASLEREALSPALSACEVMPAELGECIGDLAAIAVAAFGDEKQ